MKKLANVLAFVFMVMLIEGGIGSSVVEQEGSSLGSFVVESAPSSFSSSIIEDNSSGAGSFMLEVEFGSSGGLCRFAQLENLFH